MLESTEPPPTLPPVDHPTHEDSMTQLNTLMAVVLTIPENEIVDDLSMSRTDIWDSLRHMELIIAIEERFGVDLTGDDIVEMTSVASIRSVLRANGV